MTGCIQKTNHVFCKFKYFICVKHIFFLLATNSHLSRIVFCCCFFTVEMMTVQQILHFIRKPSICLWLYHTARFRLRRIYINGVSTFLSPNPQAYIATFSGVGTGFGIGQCEKAIRLHHSVACLSHRFLSYSLVLGDHLLNAKSTLLTNRL